MIDHYDAEQSAIDLVVSRFFSTITNKDGKSAMPHRYFCAEGVIVETCEESPSVCSLADFIAPRHILLIDGELEDFSEEELWERTDISGSVAQRLC